MTDKEQNPVDQLIDLFVYAPVGLLYEYQDVLPQLVRRGKSQVQLARVVGKMATNRGGGADAVNMVAEGIASAIARQLTDLGEAIGLAPNDEASSGPDLRLVPDADPEDPSAAVEPIEASVAVDEAPVLPIARYDELTAKEIVGLLDDLEPNQLGAIRAHEEASRARKTVLGKLDRLEAE